MKNMLICILFSISVHAQALKPVEYVDPKGFSGLWYEMARTYNSFQDKCVASSVEYKLTDDLNYAVYNRCFDTTIGGELIEYEGSAKPANGKTMSSIDMTYFWIFTKKYNVYYLEKDYSYAVVGDSDFDQVWIMSRKPSIPQNKIHEILQTLEPYMDIKRFIYTPQDPNGRYK